jgi:receptor expression-enhancing protein 1/2/3/4
MFDLLPNLLSGVLTTVIPLFSIYKLLKLSATSAVPPSADLLTPWLTFYAVLSVSMLVETLILQKFSFVIPLYAWLRLLFHAYLLLPAPQGAGFIWNEYINPFMEDHEADIERWVEGVGNEVQVKGGRVAALLVNWVRVHILGLQSAESSTMAAPPQGYYSYATGLLSRFYGSPTPQAPRAPSSTNDLFSTVRSILQSASLSAASSTSSSASPPPYMFIPGGIPEHLLPPELASAPPADRLRYIRSAQQGLAALMQAFAREEARDLAESQHLRPSSSYGEGLTKSRSETEFDKIERSEADGREERMAPRRQGSAGGGWMPWNWGADSAREDLARGKKDEDEDIPMEDSYDRRSAGRSSGVDL